MKRKFTEGPWAALPCSNFSGTLVAVVHRDNKTLFQSRHDAEVGEDVCNADANLIAAAPELLEACAEFVRKCECGEARSKRSYNQMKSAIKRAYGEKP